MTGMLPGRDGVPADVLVKPFAVEELLARMARACDGGLGAAAPA